MTGVQGVRGAEVENEPTVSVLIAAHNEAADIEACLRSVLACSSPDGFEVVVVDDGSTDGTAGIVQRVADGDARVQVLSQSRGGKGPALNHAMRHARGATCLVTDADCKVPVSWVTGMMSELEHADLVYGTFLLWDAPSDNRLWSNIVESKQRVKWGPEAPMVLSPYGASVAFKRVVWEDIGGFAESGTGEDADFSDRAIRRGWLVSNSPAEHARVLTRVPRTYPIFVRQVLRWRNVRELRDLLHGRWPRRERVASLVYASGVSLAFLLWTVGCLVTGRWAGLGLGILGVVVVDLFAYRRPLIHLAARSETRVVTLYFLGWVLCMLPVRLCETPYLLLRLVKGVAPTWKPTR